MPIGDFSVAGYSDQTGVRFDCSHWKHRVVVAGPSCSTPAAWNSGPPQICSLSPGPASAIGAATEGSNAGSVGGFGGGDYHADLQP